MLTRWPPIPEEGRNRPRVVRSPGRQEFGPRALGHRSLLAVPDGDMKKRMNRLKARQWYRPVAPMIAEERVLGGGERRRPVFSRFFPRLDKKASSFAGGFPVFF